MTIFRWLLTLGCLLATSAAAAAAAAATTSWEQCLSLPSTNSTAADFALDAHTFSVEPFPAEYATNSQFLIVLSSNYLSSRLRSNYTFIASLVDTDAGVVDVYYANSSNSVLEPAHCYQVPVSVTCGATVGRREFVFSVAMPWNLTWLHETIEHRNVSCVCTRDEYADAKGRCRSKAATFSVVFALLVGVIVLSCLLAALVRHLRNRQRMTHVHTSRSTTTYHSVPPTDWDDYE